jgi:hypothetical protein
MVDEAFRPDLAEILLQAMLARHAAEVQASPPLNQR